MRKADRAREARDKKVLATSASPLPAKVLKTAAKAKHTSESLQHDDLGLAAQATQEDEPKSQAAEVELLKVLLLLFSPSCKARKRKAPHG